MCIIDTLFHFSHFNVKRFSLLCDFFKVTSLLFDALITFKNCFVMYVFYGFSQIKPI